MKPRTLTMRQAQRQYDNMMPDEDDEPEEEAEAEEEKEEDGDE